MKTLQVILMLLICYSCIAKEPKHTLGFGFNNFLKIVNNTKNDSIPSISEYNASGITWYVAYRKLLINEMFYDFRLGINKFGGNRVQSENISGYKSYGESKSLKHQYYLSTAIGKKVVKDFYNINLLARLNYFYQVPKYQTDFIVNYNFNSIIDTSVLTEWAYDYKNNHTYELLINTEFERKIYKGLNIGLILNMGGSLEVGKNSNIFTRKRKIYSTGEETSLIQDKDYAIDYRLRMIIYPSIQLSFSF